MSADTASESAPLRTIWAGCAGIGLGWLAGIVLWAAILSISFVALNDLSLGEFIPLFGFWSAAYLIATLPVLVIALGVGRRVVERAQARIPFGLAASAILLLCLNLVGRWTPAYKAVSPRAALLVPMGILDLCVLAILFAVLLIGAARSLGVKGSMRSSGRAWLGVGAILLGVTHGLNLWYERPKRVDLAQRVAPLIEDDSTCRAEPAPADGLVLMAIDGLTWNVVATLLEEGQLPNFRRLLAGSAYGSLETLYPSYSPVVWTTMATGLTEREHGIHGFLRFRIPGVEIGIGRGPRLNSFVWWGGANSMLFALAQLGVVSVEPQTSMGRHGIALWDVASANRQSVGIFDWMKTWPVEAVHGYMVTRGGQSTMNAFPEEPVHRILQSIEADGHSSLHPELDRGERRFAEAYALFRAFEPRVSFHFNKTVDIIHDSWADGEGYFVRPPPRPYRDFRPAITASYALTDRWLGRFMDATPPGYVFAVVSDHGYEFNGTHHVYAPPGIVILSGGPFACGRVIGQADVYDIAPTLLAALGLPGTVRMQGRVLTDGMASPEVAASLERLESYPESWRARRPESGSVGDGDWDEMLERLQEMGYVN